MLCGRRKNTGAFTVTAHESGVTCDTVRCSFTVHEFPAQVPQGFTRNISELSAADQGFALGNWGTSAEDWRFNRGCGVNERRSDLVVKSSASNNTKRPTIWSRTSELAVASIRSGRSPERTCASVRRAGNRHAASATDRKAANFHIFKFRSDGCRQELHHLVRMRNMLRITVLVISFETTRDKNEGSRQNIAH